MMPGILPGIVSAGTSASLVHCSMGMPISDVILNGVVGGAGSQAPLLIAILIVTPTATLRLADHKIMSAALYWLR